MRTPAEFELQHLLADYDPAKAHAYYEKHKHLKGRKPGSTRPTSRSRSTQPLPRANHPATSSPKTKQKKALAAQIKRLEQKLNKLEALIEKKMHAEASENRKGKAKKERAQKEADKPKTAADKAKASRDNKKYRAKNQQKLASAAKKTSGKSGGSKASESGDKASAMKKQHQITDLKALATKVRGQISVAKNKLAAL